jgi:hypothetical protein
VKAATRDALDERLAQILARALVKELRGELAAEASTAGTSEPSEDGTSRRTGVHVAAGSTSMRGRSHRRAVRVAHDPVFGGHPMHRTIGNGDRHTSANTGVHTHVERKNR